MADDIDTPESPSPPARLGGVSVLNCAGVYWGLKRHKKVEGEVSLPLSEPDPIEVEEVVLCGADSEAFLRAVADPPAPAARLVAALRRTEPQEPPEELSGDTEAPEPEEASSEHQGTPEAATSEVIVMKKEPTMLNMKKATWVGKPLF